LSPSASDRVVSVSEWCPAPSDAAQHLYPQISTLPRLSRLVNDFLILARKEYFTAREFEEIISRDAQLHAWLLRQANSGCFNPSRPIDSVADASVIIGLEALKRMVYVVCCRDLLHCRMRCYRYPGNGFWLHSLAVATCCRGLSTISPTDSLTGEEAFVAGLLHDVGKRIIDENLSRRGGPRPIPRRDEITACGLDHADLSSRIVSNWGLPGAIGEAICYHHDLAPTGSTRRGPALVAMANRICNTWGVGIWTYPKYDVEIRKSDIQDGLSVLQIDSQRLSRLLDELRRTLTSLDEMLRQLGNNSIADVDAPADMIETSADETDTPPEAEGRAGRRSALDKRQTDRQRRGAQRLRDKRRRRRKKR